MFIADFGLAKAHMTKGGGVFKPRLIADFRGTVSFASLNAHYCRELSRRDDLWSWFFVLLDFYNEPLKWRQERNLSMKQVQQLKEECIENPDQMLWSEATADIPELKIIFMHLKSLAYEETPNYVLIFDQLLRILAKAEAHNM